MSKCTFPSRKKTGRGLARKREGGACSVSAEQLSLIPARPLPNCLPNKKKGFALLDF